MPTQAGRCPKYQATATRTKHTWRVSPGHDRWEATGSDGVRSAPPAPSGGSLTSQRKPDSPPLSAVPKPWSHPPWSPLGKGLSSDLWTVQQGNSTVPQPPLVPDGRTSCPFPWAASAVPLRDPGPLPTFLCRTLSLPPSLITVSPVPSESQNPSLRPAVFVAIPLSLA